MKRAEEYRYDKHGRMKLMARVDGWVMCRRRGCVPFVRSEKEWAAMSPEPIADALIAARKEMGK
jgi:hypothetical protein